MTVLFIAPGFEEIYGSYSKVYRRGFINPPLSLCYLASAVEMAGHSAKIIDAEAENLTLNGILRETRDYNPHLIGITATSVDFHKAKELIKHLKSALPDIPVILGGTHVNIFGTEVLKEVPEIDFGCIGDGEDLIVELLNMLAGSGTKNLDKIAGLLYRKNGQPIQNHLRRLETNLDRYAFPAHHLLKTELYKRTVPYQGYMTTASFMSSRGCPYKCIYCAVEKIPGGRIGRLRTAGNVLDELEIIVKNLGIKHVAFNDDCLTLNKRRIYEICEGIHRRGLKFTWEGLSRADIVDKELLKEMKGAGFVRISYGIESGNSDILKVLQKEETLEEIEHAFKISKEVGLVTRGSIILGAPYETRKTVRETLRFAKKLKGLDQVIINVLQPYPGTKVRDMILNGEGGSRFVEDEKNHGKLQRFGNASIAVNDLSPEDLIFYQRWGFFRFYMRLSTIFNNLKFTGWKILFQDGINFLKSIAC